MTQQKQPAPSPARAPAAVVLPTNTRPLDIEDSPIESLWAFLRRQPTKHFRGFALWLITTLALFAGAGYAIGVWVSNLQHQNEMTQLKSDLNLRTATAAGDQSVRIVTLNSEWERRLSTVQTELTSQLNSLKVDNADLAARVKAAETIAVSLREELKRKDGDLAMGHGVIRSLQGEVAAADKKVQAARNCAGLKSEFDQIAEQARKLQLEKIPLDSFKERTRREQIDAETRILDARSMMIKTQLEGCSK